MSDTHNGPWMDRTPRILTMTAFLRNGQHRLLVQEHDATIAGSLRPQFVIETDLWTEGMRPATANREVILAIAAALMEMCNPSTVDGHRLSRG